GGQAGTSPRGRTAAGRPPPAPRRDRRNDPAALPAHPGWPASTGTADGGRSAISAVGRRAAPRRRPAIGPAAPPDPPDRPRPPPSRAPPRRPRSPRPRADRRPRRVASSIQPPIPPGPADLSATGSRLLEGL